MSALKIDDLDEAVKLRNYRRNAQKLMDKAWSGFIKCSLNDEEVFGVIGANAVRRAIEMECRTLIDEYESKLRELGVEP